MIKRYEIFQKSNTSDTPNSPNDYKVSLKTANQEIKVPKKIFINNSFQTPKNNNVFPEKMNFVNEIIKSNTIHETNKIICEKSIKNSLKRCYKIYELFDDDSLAQSFSFKLSKYDTMNKFFNKKENQSKIIFGTNFKDEEDTNFHSIYSYFSKNCLNNNELFDSFKVGSNTMINFGIAPHKILHKLCKYFNIKPQDNLIKNYIISYHEKLSRLHIFEYKPIKKIPINIDYCLKYHLSHKCGNNKRDEKKCNFSKNELEKIDKDNEFNEIHRENSYKIIKMSETKNNSLQNIVDNEKNKERKKFRRRKKLDKKTGNVFKVKHILKKYRRKRKKELIILLY